MAPQPPYPDVFGESRYYITSEHMKAFRARLFSDARKKDTACYHPDDRQRLLSSDEYCWRFIVHNRYPANPYICALISLNYGRALA